MNEAHVTQYETTYSHYYVYSALKSMRTS